MATPSVILPGYSAALWAQSETSRTSLGGGFSNTNLGIWTAQVATLVTAVAGSFVVGQSYVIVSLGSTTTQAIWNTIAGTSGVTYAVGSVFTCAAAGTAGDGRAMSTTGAPATNGVQLKVEAVPAFGQDDAVASFSVAGSRQSDKIPVQAAPTSVTITAAWNPSDSAIQQVRTDAYNGVNERTYVVAATDGSGNVVAYAFNGRVGNFQIDSQPGAEAKAIFTIHPRGGAYGWSNS